MVTRLLCLFLAVGPLIQINEATPSPLVIAQYMPKFFSLSIEIFKTVRNGTGQISDTQNKIKSLVDSVANEIDQQRDKLEQFVKASEAEAEHKHTNITACLIEEKYDINHTYFQILDDCRLKYALQHLQENGKKLAKEELFVPLIIKWCIVKHPLQGDKLKICFDDKINDVESKMAKFMKDVETTLPDAMEFSSNCSQKNQKDIGETIDKIYWNFKNCVDEMS